MIKEGFYKLFGELVYVDDVIPFGAQIQVFYYKKGKRKLESYIADSIRETQEDFENTNEEFDLLDVEEEIVEEPRSQPIVKDKSQYYKITYTPNGSSTSEVVEENIPNKRMAFALRGSRIKNDKYRGGRLDVLPQ